MERVVVTGASGFVGRSLCKALLGRGYLVRAILRDESKKKLLPEECEFSIVGNIDASTKWEEALNEATIIIHLASRVHIMMEEREDPIAAFREINVAGTEKLARTALRSGIRQIVFISTIGVNGTHTTTKPFTEDDIPDPDTPYAQSKLEAEEILYKITAGTDTDITILRPTLIYGPEDPGNFKRLLSLVYKGIPLPFSLVTNQKNFIYLGNFVDIIVRSINDQNAAGKTYVVSDGETFSTSELLRILASSLECPLRLFPMPAAILRLVGKLLGRSSEMEKLIGSLVVDMSKIREELSWVPPIKARDGLKETAIWYKRMKEEKRSK